MGKIENAVQAQSTKDVAQTANRVASQSVSTLMSSILDSENYRKRFDELLGKRSPQFISSIVSLVNADKNLSAAFYQAPATVIQAAMKAATYDLPIDPALGYAYIVPFKNRKEDGSARTEASFIMGYRGMIQLALRTGAYKKLNVTDVREGEVKSYNRLTEEINIDFIEDEDEREKAPITGYVGYFQLINGTEKTIYMTKAQIVAHEKKHRKGQFMGKGWKEDFDAMAQKTVLRKLIGKWGLMSIDYQRADAQTVAIADAIAKGKFDDEDENVIFANYEEATEEK